MASVMATAAPDTASASASAPASSPAAAAPAATPTISVAPTDWSCDKCTYANKQKDAKCTVCNEGVRPSASTPSSATPSPSSASATATAATSTSSAAASPAKDNTKEDDDAAGATGGAAKKSSYYYFSSTPKEQAAQYQPKLIDPATASAQPVINRVGSAWNAAGTWEDRDVSKLAKERLKARFSAGVDVPASDLPNGSLRFVGCSKCDGEASIVMSRGKKKLGFELSVQLQFRGTFKGAEVDGTVDIPDFEDGNAADGDYQFNVSCNTAEVRQYVRSAKGQAVVRKALDAFVADLKDS